MTSPQDSPGQPTTPIHLEPIADRVRQRLQSAGVALSRRERASRPTSRRRGRPPVTSLELSSTPDPLAARERAELRTVFLELGAAHRQYRARTGSAGTPALREAAYAFKREPSVASLTSVAALLDELGLLGW